MFDKNADEVVRHPDLVSDCPEGQLITNWPAMPPHHLAEAAQRQVAGLVQWITTANFYNGDAQRTKLQNGSIFRKRKIDPAIGKKIILTGTTP